MTYEPQRYRARVFTFACGCVARTVAAHPAVAEAVRRYGRRYRVRGPDP
ncbi:hypothetical protein ACWGSK_23735 [Nocardiopsis sp. NPDC055551]